MDKKCVILFRVMLYKNTRMIFHMHHMRKVCTTVRVISCSLRWLDCMKIFPHVSHVSMFDYFSCFLMPFHDIATPPKLRPCHTASRISALFMSNIPLPFYDV